ncbi:hypothetical protein [Thermococcus sp. M36]|uniref:hypothetical protein n=1 Tax=Thermococcus sp. M36 TaxID=1638261 RepID=UPI00197F1EF2|nr:hypothetical protein [Thermococcus sp. M36]
MTPGVPLRSAGRCVVGLLQQPLPVGERLPNGVSIFGANFKVLANGRIIRGIGVYCNNPMIKLVGMFEEGEVVKIAFERNQKESP